MTTVLAGLWLLPSFLVGGGGCAMLLNEFMLDRPARKWRALLGVAVMLLGVTSVVLFAILWKEPLPASGCPDGYVVVQGAAHCIEY